MPHNDDAQTLIQLLNCPTLQLQTETDNPPRRFQSEAAARCVLEGPLERKHKKGCMKLMHRAQPIPSRLLRRATLPDYTDRLSCLLPRTRAVVGFFFFNCQHAVTPAKRLLADFTLAAQPRPHFPARKRTVHEHRPGTFLPNTDSNWHY